MLHLELNIFFLRNKEISLPAIDLDICPTHIGEKSFLEKCKTERFIILSNS